MNLEFKEKFVKLTVDKDNDDNVLCTISPYDDTYIVLTIDEILQLKDILNENIDEILKLV